MFILTHKIAISLKNTFDEAGDLPGIYLDACKIPIKSHCDTHKSSYKRSTNSIAHFFNQVNQVFLCLSKPNKLFIMNYNFKKAWSTAGSLKRTSSFGGQPKKLFRHLSLVSNKSSPKSISFYGESRLRRTFESGSIERSLGFNINSFESYGDWKNDGLFSMNSKETMMSLNDRLATYLEKVTSLKEENQRLERKIKEWYEKNAPQQLPDYSKKLKSIEELQREV